MNAARRSKRRRDWPRGLYEPRPGYYVWRHPDGRTFVLGRIPMATAVNEALAANAHLGDTRPGLVERLTGGDKTISDVLDKMPVPRAAETAKAYRNYDARIRAKLGSTPCNQLTVAACADMVEELRDQGKEHAARYLRSRLIQVCRRAQGLGWMESNPAKVTDAVSPEVKRARLSLEQFQEVYKKASEVALWLQHAMLLALVTGQDRSTVCAMRRDDVRDGCLITSRSKTARTNRPVAIPLALRLNALDLSLAELVARDTGIDSVYLVHQIRSSRDAKPGTPIAPHRVTNAFADARELAGITGKGAPTFHEIRSLSKRLYDAQGGVDTKTLLGHASDSAAALYADPRSMEPQRVRIADDVNAK